MSDFIRDARFGARMLLKSPALTAVAVLCLALGIGANTAIFSVVNRVLLQPLPYGDPGQLYAIYTSFPGSDLPKNALSEDEVDDLRERMSSLASVSSYAMIDANVSLEPDAPVERIVAAVTDWNTFETLDVAPAIGRVFREEESEPGSEYVVVIGYDLWKRRYGGDPDVLGRPLVIDTEAHTIVGVAPREFRFPLEPDAEIFAPLARYPELQTPRQNRYLRVIARAKPGVTEAELEAELATLATRLEADYPDHYRDYHDFGLFAVSLQDELIGPVRPVLLLLLGAVAFVLLIACANVASLLLARGMSRERELALRRALGAGRRRLLRQLITESMVLALLGAVGGLLIALWGVDLLVALAPGHLPKHLDVGVDGTVLAFALGLALFTGLLFGLLPALYAARSRWFGSLKEGGYSTTASRSSVRMRSGLVAVEIALALVLLIGAGLMTRSLSEAKDADLGFEKDQVLSLKLKLPYPTHRDPEDRLAFYERLFRRIDHVGAISHIPLGDGRSSGSCELEGYADTAPPEADTRVVNGDYFEVMGIPLIAGRTFDELEHRAEIPTVIIDEVMADKYWPDGAVGKKIRMLYEDEWHTIIGVVGHVKHDGLASTGRGQIYLPYLIKPPLRMTLVVRTPHPEAVAEELQAQVAALAPDVPLYDIKTMDQRVSDSLSIQRFAALLLGLFAAVALALAVVGIYAVMSFIVAQRTREIGIRTALGARPDQVVKLLLRQGLRITAAGVAIGIAASLALTHAMSPLLYGVSAVDPLTYLGGAVAATAAALVACYFAARRATRIDPMTALRVE